MTISTEWERVGSVAPTALADARETLHHAAQLLALVGASYLPARENDSHTSMHWLEEQRALATEIVEAARPFRVALRPEDLTLLALDLGAGDPAVLPLGGRTRDEALAWLRARIGDAGRDPATLRTSLHFTIVADGTDRGAPFIRHDAALPELARWYGNAARLLERRRETTAGASAVRCWPHHFDIATLMTIPRGPIQTIGVGMSPGDASYGEPYFYLAPSPHPTAIPGALSVGHWHTSDWWGAVLPGSEITRLSDPMAQDALVSRFIDEARANLYV